MVTSICSLLHLVIQSSRFNIAEKSFEVYQVWANSRPEYEERIDLDFAVQKIWTCSKYLCISGSVHSIGTNWAHRLQVRSLADPSLLLIDDISQQFYGVVVFYCTINDTLFKLMSGSLTKCRIPSELSKISWEKVETGDRKYTSHTWYSFSSPFLCLNSEVLINLETEKYTILPEDIQSQDIGIFNAPRHLLLKQTKISSIIYYLDKVDFTTKMEVPFKLKHPKEEFPYPILSLEIWLVMSKDSIGVFDMSTGELACSVKNPVSKKLDLTTCGSKIILVEPVVDTRRSTESVFIFDWIPQSKSLVFKHKLSVNKYAGISCFRMPNGYGMLLKLGDNVHVCGNGIKTSKFIFGLTNLFAISVKNGMYFTIRPIEKTSITVLCCVKLSQEIQQKSKRQKK